MMFSGIAGISGGLFAYLVNWNWFLCREQKSVAYLQACGPHCKEPDSANGPRWHEANKRTGNDSSRSLCPRAEKLRTKNRKLGTANWEKGRWEQGTRKRKSEKGKEKGRGKRERRTGNWVTNGVKSPGGFSHKNQFQFSANEKYYATLSHSLAALGRSGRRGWGGSDSIDCKTT